MSWTAETNIKGPPGPPGSGGGISEAPTDGQTYGRKGSTAQWLPVTSGGGGSGDVVGPAGAIADRIAVYNGTTGKLIKDGGNLIADLAPVTHTHTASQVTDFSEAVDDRVGALLVAGSNITLNYNDPANTLTINSAGGGGGAASGITVTPAGNIAATDVQAALVELDNEKVALAGGAGAVMTGVLTLPVGAVGTPSLTFTTALTSGLYYTASSVNVSVGGSNKLSVQSGAINCGAVLKSTDGTQTSPGLGFLLETSSGFWRKSAGNISISMLNSEVMSWASTGKVTTAFGAVVLPGNPVNPLEAAPKQYVDAMAGASATTPKGRLTLQSVTPVMIASQSAKNTLYYTPYLGAYVPIYNGSAMVSTLFSEISVLTTDTTKNPAAIGANKCNDWFVWNDAGTVRLSHGPDWTNDTTRSAGTALTRIAGILTNAVAITNGPGISLGTYVGTTRSDASSLLNYVLGGAASGGVAALLHVWNSYNRVQVTPMSQDTGASYTYSSATFRQARNSAAMAINFVSGLAEEGIQGTYSARVDVTVGGSIGQFGVALDNVVPLVAASFVFASSTATYANACANVAPISPQLGAHYIAAIEAADGTNNATYNASVKNSLHGLLRM